MPILSKAIKGIGSGIGLASEAIAHRKERSKSTEPQNRRPEGNEVRVHAPTGSATVEDSASDSDVEDEEFLNRDEAAWALDEASGELQARYGPPPGYTYSNESGVAIPSSSQARDFTPLPSPVIIPQRRPHSVGRGFIRAYAPVLESCAGISQTEFLSFLDALDKSAETSPVFTVINIAAFGAGFIPSPIAMAVTTAVQVVNSTAQEMTSRRGRNAYLDKMNREMFMPRGLFCMIMAIKPEMADEAILNGDISSTDKALVKSAGVDDGSTFMRNLKSIRLQSGTAQGEMALPEAAPLVFPALDAAAATKSDSGAELSFKESMQTKLKTSGEFINTNIDRRARDTYAGTYPTSKLATSISGESEASKPYASRYSDPNHPANSGTILGLVTGGRFDPGASRRVSRAEHRARARGQPGLTEEEKRNVMLDRPGGEGFGAGATRRQMRQKEGAGTGLLGKPVKKTAQKILRPDVLYLTIVNLPSEAEMQEMRQLLERNR